jgi:hypothetical protein
MSADEKIRIKDLPEMPLVAQVLQVMVNDAHATSSALIDSLMKQNADLNATLAAVRTGICDLLVGPYAPSERAINRALWPSAEYVDMFREDGES